MDNTKLIPAPIDEKNITTDWIEDIFEFSSCAQNGNKYVGFINDAPVMCVVEGNSLIWKLITNYSFSWHIQPALEELEKRLRVVDDNDRIHVDYTKSHDGTMIMQSFYWSDND